MSILTKVKNLYYLILDTLIKPSHTESIMKNYHGPYEKIILKGHHNEIREEKFKA